MRPETHMQQRDATVQQGFLLPERQWVLQSAEFVSFLSVRLFDIVVLLSYEDLGTWRHFSGFILPNLSFFCFVCLHLLFSLPYAMQNGWQGEDGVERGEGGGERERWRLLEGCKVLTSSKVPLLDSFPYAARVLALRQSSGHAVLHKCLNPLDITIITHTCILGWLDRAPLRAPYEGTGGVLCVTVPCLSRACDVLLSGSLQGDSAAACCSFLFRLENLVKLLQCLQQKDLNATANKR